MEEPQGIMPTLRFLIQGAKILCLGIVVTVSDIYLGQVTSAISQSTNPQITSTVKVTLTVHLERLMKLNIPP